TPGEPPSETKFDIDAALKSVQPNQAGDEVAETVVAPRSAPSDFADVADSYAWDARDSVDNAFAELDRITGPLNEEGSNTAMLLPDEKYTSQPEPIAQDKHSGSTIARTPDSGIEAVAAPPVAFVSETLAEWYFQQGFRDEALAVYRQLLAMSPADSVLAARVAELEGGAVAPAAAPGESEEPARHVQSYEPAASVASVSSVSSVSSTPAAARVDAAGQSMRSFLGVLARRRAPMRRREPAREQPVSVISEPQASGLSALFGSSSGADDGAAAVLAGAFAQPNAEGEAFPGRPTRAAAQELSLGAVFGSGAAPSAARAASFDEFFSTGSANESVRSPLDEEGSDMEQFTAWLEGLKKK
ncbi:MAG: hypothetical protein ACT4P6_04310, partial [Gemmatimonadaceae bacterium]